MDNKSTIGIGHFDQQGNPCLNLHICGIKHESPGLQFECIIDTGFTGFLQIPLSVAMGLSLPLQGTQNVILADDSTLVMLTALASVTLDN